MTKEEFLKTIKGKMIISCQAPDFRTSFSIIQIFLIKNI